MVLLFVRPEKVTEFVAIFVRLSGCRVFVAERLNVREGVCLLLERVSEIDGEREGGSVGEGEGVTVRETENVFVGFVREVERVCVSLEIERDGVAGTLRDFVGW